MPDAASDGFYGSTGSGGRDDASVDVSRSWHSSVVSESEM